MPELRRDPVTSRWIIIAVERAKRPDDFRAVPSVPKAKECPFCEGFERATPPEIAAVRTSGGRNEPGWRVRVVPNKFPALMIEGDLDRRGEGMYDIMNGVGAHEVIIESPKHLLSLTEMAEESLREVFRMYRERLLDLRRDSRMVYGLLFKNVGEAAGASLEHTHSQLIVTPIVPLRVQTEIDRSKLYFEYRGRCLLCDMVKQELQSGIRLVCETQQFVSFEPFASRFPFETHIIPKRHHSHFESIDEGAMGELASILRTTMLRIEKAVNHPPYNYLIHTSPLNTPPLEHYHWHFEIIPRITRVAGFEWGTGFYINPVPPEHAAQYLREVRIP
ncbi:MAG: galactose-1-phosphate uridylyltransferase [Planctomycetes bacterium]|nr:galactose-1-phosphate uridylyltransferase [Planctomycetota bacterium]